MSVTLPFVPICAALTLRGNKATIKANSVQHTEEENDQADQNLNSESTEN